MQNDSDKFVQRSLKKFKNTGKIGLAIAGIVAAGALVDDYNKSFTRNNVKTMLDAENKKRSRIDDKRRNTEGKDFAYMPLDQFRDIVFDMYDNRKGSSNTWGGKRYY